MVIKSCCLAQIGDKSKLTIHVFFTTPSFSVPSLVRLGPDSVLNNCFSALLFTCHLGLAENNNQREQGQYLYANIRDACWILSITQKAHSCRTTMNVNIAQHCAPNGGLHCQNSSCCKPPGSCPSISKQPKNRRYGSFLFPLCFHSSSGNP